MHTLVWEYRNLQHLSPGSSEHIKLVGSYAVDWRLVSCDFTCDRQNKQWFKNRRWTGSRPNGVRRTGTRHLMSGWDNICSLSHNLLYLINLLFFVFHLFSSPPPVSSLPPSFFPPSLPPSPSLCSSSSHTLLHFICEMLENRPIFWQVSHVQSLSTPLLHALTSSGTDLVRAKDVMLLLCLLCAWAPSTACRYKHVCTYINVHNCSHLNKCYTSMSYTNSIVQRIWKNEWSVQLVETVFENELLITPSITFIL